MLVLVTYCSGSTDAIRAGARGGIKAELRPDREATVFERDGMWGREKEEGTLLGMVFEVRGECVRAVRFGAVMYIHTYILRASLLEAVASIDGYAPPRAASTVQCVLVRRRWEGGSVMCNSI